MKYLLLALVLIGPASASQVLGVVEDPAGDQHELGQDNQDLLLVTLSGDNETLTVALTVAGDLRGQRSQQAVGFDLPAHTLFVQCSLGQTTPAEIDEQSCTASLPPSREQAAGVTQPFAHIAPDMSDDGRTWSITFSREDANVPPEAVVQRVYAQTKYSFATPAGEAAPSGAPGLEQDLHMDTLSEEVRWEMGVTPAVTAPATTPEPVADRDRDIPGFGVLGLISAVLILARRR